MPETSKDRHNEKPCWEKFLPLLVSAAGVAALTALIQFFQLESSIANVSMLYLLVVTLSALYLGRGPAIWASLLSFLSLNWFFVTPRYTFIVQSPAEWLALCMFLLTAMVTGQLTAMLKASAQEAKQRQHETAVLAEASWAVASQLDTNSALLEVVRQIARVAPLCAAAVIAIESDRTPQVLVFHSPDASLLPERKQEIQATSASLTRELAGSAAGGSSIRKLWESGWASRRKENSVCLPIAMNENLLGAVYLQFVPELELTSEQRQIIDSLVNHTAVVLQRDSLMKSQAQAAALADADRLKTALLSMVSHDFRSPLTSIKASVSTLLSEGKPLDAEIQRGLCQGIELETDRLNSMVGNILDLSRLEADAWRPRLEPTAVTELIGAALDLFNSDCNSRVIVKLEPLLTELNVDPVQMVQVIKNLVENALKYSAGDTTVEIQTKLENGSAVIEILDRGRGLPSSELVHIFEPFYRARDLQESSVPGVGIGLAVCKGLVEAHGGKLAADNRQGGGAIFRVTLPAGQMAAGGDVIS